MPEKMKGKWKDWIFGCDICQDVCPWNSKLKPHNEKAFTISDEIQYWSKDDWANMDKSSFKKIFKNTPFERAKFEGLKRNISVY
jgi:epoxyqueuosine reductase